MSSDPSPVPSASEVVARFRQTLETESPPVDDPHRDGMMQLLLQLLRSNEEQWELEDITRSMSADDATVARAKRSIDRLNLERHRLTESLDAAIAAELVQSVDATPSTETPAMAFDRLSVLAIRLDRTNRAAQMAGNGGHEFGERLVRLSGQLDGLAAAIDALLDDVRAGKRRFIPYEHLKLYAPQSPHPRRKDGNHHG